MGPTSTSGLMVAARRWFTSITLRGLIYRIVESGRWGYAVLQLILIEVALRLVEGQEVG